MLTHSGWCHSSDLMRKGNYSLVRPTSWGQQPPWSSSQRCQGLGSTLMVTPSHIYSTFSASQLVRNNKARDQIKKKRESQERLVSSFLLDLWWQDCFIPSRVSTAPPTPFFLDKRSCTVIRLRRSLMLCLLQLFHYGKLHLSPSDYCHPLPQNKWLITPRKACGAKDESCRWIAFHT